MSSSDQADCFAAVLATRAAQSGQSVHSTLRNLLHLDPDPKACYTLQEWLAHKVQYALYAAARYELTCHMQECT